MSNLLGGIANSLGRAVAGQDGQMGVEDWLQLLGTAASTASMDVPGIISAASTYAGRATGSEELQQIGQLAGLASGVKGATGALAGSVSGGAKAAADLTSAADVAKSGDAMASGMGALKLGGEAADKASVVGNAIGGDALRLSDVLAKPSMATGAATGAATKGVQAGKATLGMRMNDFNGFLESDTGQFSTDMAASLIQDDLERRQMAQQANAQAMNKKGAGNASQPLPTVASQMIGQGRNRRF